MTCCEDDQIEGINFFPPIGIDFVEVDLVVVQPSFDRFLVTADEKRRPENGEGGVVEMESPPSVTVVLGGVDEIRWMDGGEETEERLELVSGDGVADERDVAVANEGEEGEAVEGRESAGVGFPSPL